MKVVVATCDRYDHLMPGFAHQFNKYWGADQAVDVVGFRQPLVPLPLNFSFHAMEPVETRAWSTNLRAYVEQIPDKYFVFLLDDYWLTETVDMREVRRMENVVKHGAVKGDLSENTKYFEHTKRADGLVQAMPSAQYRTSTQPCIWQREFMLNLLTPGLNPWQFELQHNAAVNKGSIVGPCRQIYVYANIYYKGSPASYMIDRLTPSDKVELTELGMFNGIL